MDQTDDDGMVTSDPDSDWPITHIHQLSIPFSLRSVIMIHEWLRIDLAEWKDID